MTNADQPRVPRPWAELIKQWADGAEIEVSDTAGNWCIIDNPQWHHDAEYRLRPTPSIIPFTFEDRDMLRGKWVNGVR